MESHELRPGQLAAMPLHSVTERLGLEGLEQRFHLEMADLDEVDRAQVYQAYELANELHKDDTRTTEPYMNHILRVCLRIKVYYGITDPDVLAAALLHDSVEDHPKKLTGIEEGELGYLKAAALDVIAEKFNLNVATMVSGVTNPEFDPSKDKYEQYLEHLNELMTTGNPGSVIIKMSDFTDNATGIIYTLGPKLNKLAKKYLPVVPVMRQGLTRPDLPIDIGVREHIADQLNKTEDRCNTILLAA